MKQFAALLIALCLVAPAAAQDDPPAGEGLFNFMERMLRDFMTEAEPQLRQLERGLTELEPELDRLFDRMRGMTQYYPPEILPNGDILIRRRQVEEGTPEDTPEVSPDGPPLPEGEQLEL